MNDSHCFPMNRLNRCVSLDEPEDLLLSVIVVSADSGAHLVACVEQVLVSTTRLELILIDNASTDGMPQTIARDHAHDARLRCLYNQVNLGFGKAVNRAAASARGKHLLILNPDCILGPGDLVRLEAVLQSHPKAGLVGAVVCNEKGLADPASRRRDPLLRRALVELFCGRGEGVNVAGDIPLETLEVEAVSGAVMLLPRMLFEQLGGFDEAYFLHCEDLDLCRRVRDLGWCILLAGDVRVLHSKGTSSRHRPVFVSYHKHCGMWRWFCKFDPAARHPLIALAVRLGIWAHFLLHIPRQIAGTQKRNAL